MREKKKIEIAKIITFRSQVRSFKGQQFVQMAQGHPCPVPSPVPGEALRKLLRHQAPPDTIQRPATGGAVETFTIMHNNVNIPACLMVTVVEWGSAETRQGRVGYMQRATQSQPPSLAFPAFTPTTLWTDLCMPDEKSAR